MLYIYCGGDTARARKNYIAKKDSLVKEDYDLLQLTPETLIELPNWLYASNSLFEEKRGFYGENLLGKKEQRKIFKDIEANESLIIVLFEEKVESRDVKKYFSGATISDAKLPHSIFTLLDSLFPGNLRATIAQLQSVVDVVDEHMVLYMLQRRTKELILAQDGLSLPGAAGWQMGKLKSQASRWNGKTLVSFYDKLITIERGAKTSDTPYSATQSLEILFCFYIR